MQQRPYLTTIWRALVLLSLFSIGENTLRIKEYTERTWRAVQPQAR